MAHIDEHHRRRLKAKVRALRISSPRIDDGATLVDLLKACPGCGDEPIPEIWLGHQFGEVFLQCQLCGHSGPVGRTLFDAVDAWNRQSADAAKDRLSNDPIRPHQDAG